MQVFQTCGVPPSLGRIILPIIGCTKNSRKALTKRVPAKNSSKGLPPQRAGSGTRIGSRGERVVKTGRPRSGSSAAGPGVDGRNGEGQRRRAVLLPLILFDAADGSLAAAANS